MEHQFHLTRISSNAKLGGLPASTTSADSCPDNCSFKGGNGCYGDSGPISMHWRAVNQRTRGVSLDEFCTQIRQLPKGQLWRHNQVGDLPGNGEIIDQDRLNALVHANRGRKGFTYTHYNPALAENAAALALANLSGFTINLSAETLEQADAYADLRVGPVVVTLPASATENLKTPEGRTVTVCPATIRDDVVCATCGLCQVATRKQIVGFPAHGRDASKVEKVFWLKAKQAQVEA